MAFVQGVLHFLIWCSGSKSLSFFSFLFFSSLAAVLSSLFSHSFKKMWHHGKPICLEGLFDNV